MKNKPYVLFINDTETTSANPFYGQIIDSAFIVTTPDLKEIGRYQTRIKYDDKKFDWNLEAEKVHKISLHSALSTGCTLNKYFESIEKMIQDVEDILNYEFKPVFVAQNAYFDYSMHIVNAAKIGRNFDYFGYKPFDTSVLFGLESRWDKSGLSHWIDKSCEASQDRHTALYDTEVLVKALRENCAPLVLRLFG